jgi:hypothetical protein
MRSRTSPEKLKISSPSFDLFGAYHRAFSDRPMKAAKISSLVLCASLFGFGCTVRTTPFVPPITAAAAGQAIAPAPGKVVRATASSLPGPAIQATNHDRKIEAAPNLSPAEQKKAPATNRPSASNRVHLAHDPQVTQAAAMKSRVRNPSPQVAMATPGDRDVGAAPAARPVKAESFARQLAKEKPAVAATATKEKRDGGVRRDQPESTRMKIAAQPAPLSDSGDLALQIVGDESGETDGVRTPRTDTTFASVSMPRDLSGTFAGTSFRYAKGQISLAEITFTIVGSGNGVTGTWSSARGTSGKFDGTVEGSAIRSLRLEQNGPCSGAYSGLAIVVRKGSMLDGSYAGADCEGKVDGSFIVRKQ